MVCLDIAGRSSHARAQTAAKVRTEKRVFGGHKKARKHRRWTPGGDHVVMVRGESVQKWTHKKSPLPSSPLDLHPAPLAFGADGEGVKEGAFFTHNLRTTFSKRTAKGEKQAPLGSASRLSFCLSSPAPMLSSEAPHPQCTRWRLHRPGRSGGNRCPWWCSPGHGPAVWRWKRYPRG